MGGPIILLSSRPLVYNMGMVRVLVETHRNLILFVPLCRTATHRHIAGFVGRGHVP